MESCLKYNAKNNYHDIFFRERGENCLFFFASSQSFIMFPYSLGYQLWGLLENFDWLVNQVNVLAIYFNLILSIIIGDPHEFIGHCLIPLDPCISLLCLLWM